MPIVLMTPEFACRADGGSIISTSEADAMRLALQLAAHGPVQGPNPRVGCVILSPTGELLAQGYHRGAGTPHAEAAALAQAQLQNVDVRGATAIVTLEPCNHVGRTPACAQALVSAGITRVVVGVLDPNPAASGGLATLRAAGIEVEVLDGALRSHCEDLNSRWLAAVAQQRPYVIWKFAATLDGRSAAADGSSRWITSAAARHDVHLRRAQVDAIGVGTGTVLADDPALTVRLVEPTPGFTPPLRVLIGTRDLPSTARVNDDQAPTLHLRTRDPHEVMAALHEAEIRTFWLEGGPRLAAAFWQAGLVDEVLAYTAPVLLGAGIAAVGDLGIATIAEAARLEPIETVLLHPDVLVRARPIRPQPAQSDETTSPATRSTRPSETRH